MQQLRLSYIPSQLKHQNICYLHWDRFFLFLGFFCHFTSLAPFCFGGKTHKFCIEDSPDPIISTCHTSASPSTGDQPWTGSTPAPAPSQHFYQKLWPIISLGQLQLITASSCIHVHIGTHTESKQSQAAQWCFASSISQLSMQENTEKKLTKNLPILRKTTTKSILQ